MGRWFFYWVLVRHRLPAMWRYFEACVHADKHRTDDIMDLGASVLVRGVRALQARDAVGQWFYAEEGRDREDEMLYHLEYLTLALGGAIDAQARVAFRAYGLTGDERSAYFGRRHFMQTLAPKAPALHAIASDQRFEDLMVLLRDVRNTIHGAALRAMTVQTATAETSVIELRQELGDRLWDAAERRDTAHHWGLSRVHGAVRLDAYTYAFTLVAETLHAIDQLADATDVELLLPSGTSLRYSRGHRGNLIEPEQEEHIALLG
jgi:hypothetical protein